MDTLPLSARPNLADYTERAEQLVEAAKPDPRNPTPYTIGATSVLTRLSVSPDPT